MADFLENWHHVVFQKDGNVLDQLLDPDVCFHSPFVWKPKQGKAITTAILMNVVEVFQDFQYHRQFNDGKNWVLEFSARVGEFQVKGVDLIHLNDDGRIDTFEVMIRPANGLQALGEEMGRRLEKMKGS